MNLAIHHRGSLTTRSTSTSPSAATPARRSRAADYIADVFLVALLAAPFLLFEAPSTLPDAVIASRAGPATLSQPAAAPSDDKSASSARR